MYCEKKYAMKKVQTKYLPQFCAVSPSPFVLTGSVFTFWVLTAACFLDSTTSGITASMSDSVSIQRSDPSFN